MWFCSFVFFKKKSLTAVISSRFSMEKLSEGAYLFKCVNKYSPGFSKIP